MVSNSPFSSSFCIVIFYFISESSTNNDNDNDSDSDWSGDDTKSEAHDGEALDEPETIDSNSQIGMYFYLPKITLVQIKSKFRVIFFLYFSFHILSPCWTLSIFLLYFGEILQ